MHLVLSTTPPNLRVFPEGPGPLLFFFFFLLSALSLPAYLACPGFGPDPHFITLTLTLTLNLILTLHPPSSYSHILIAQTHLGCILQASGLLTCDIHTHTIRVHKYIRQYCTGSLARSPAEPSSSFTCPPSSIPLFFCSKLPTRRLQRLRTLDGRTRGSIRHPCSCIGLDLGPDPIHSSTRARSPSS